MKSKVGLTRFFWCLGFTFLILISGCVRQASNHGWQSVNGQGPQIGPNQSAGIYKNCTKSTSKSGCLWAFEDQQGEKITIPELIHTLDQTLQNTPESRHWLQDPQSGKTRIPYQFTILSISPTIVVGYPITAGNSSYCTNQAKYHYCLKSGLFSGAYEVSSSLRYAPNLVWFSPEHGPTIFKAPVGTKSVFFVINGTTVRMKRNGNQWLFKRAN